MQIEIDDRVQRMFALRAPMAVDLQFVFVVSCTNGDLERVVDQA
jgi:phosphate uptake regulator